MAQITQRSDDNFISVVAVVSNCEEWVASALEELLQRVRSLTPLYEIVLVDNGSRDRTFETLTRIVTTGNSPGIVVHALSRRVDLDLATWFAVDQTLGDVVVAIDLRADSVDELPTLVEAVSGGADLAFGINTARDPKPLLVSLVVWAFHVVLRVLGGIRMRDFPSFRAMNRHVVTTLAQRPSPSHAYRVLPAQRGYVEVRHVYRSAPRHARRRDLADEFDRGWRMLLTTRKRPLRVAASLSLLGAALSFAYSVYVVLVAILKSQVAEGWVSLSLVMTAMFFLISLTLAILGEFMLLMADGQVYGQQVFVTREITSPYALEDSVNVDVRTVDATGTPPHDTGAAGL